ncbi:unnamed protein product [Peronospora belbahrii]|uniref:BZIP domain-containing protein n=1 Tax=Peronospora belbahrii TaxID=622444 RepID=A0ABN8CVE2_9STRA|nr:unnamed protein product [Peronospora belbahrii]
MNTCILQPPTKQILSDDIVLGVQQRSKSYRTTYVSRNDEPNMINDLEQRTYLTAAVKDQLFSTGREKKRHKSVDFASSKLRLLAISCGGSMSFKPEHRFKGGEEQKAVITEWVQSHVKYQREIRRLRQIRYRRKKEDYTVSLEMGNSKLQNEIAKLQERQRAICSAIPSEKTPWNVVVEYFRLFRFGYREPVSFEGLSEDLQPSAQLTFLQATMTPDVLFNAGRGVESMMKNWKSFTLWFQDVEIELHGLGRCGLSSFVASITTSFTITEFSLRQVFPCLLKGDRSDISSLGQKLLGQRIVMRGSTRFDWNDSYGRVTSIISESDMLTPMLHIVGCLEDVSRVFEGSLISLSSAPRTISPAVENF